MWSSRLTRQIALATGAAALVGMGALTACSKEDKEKPQETKSPSSSAPETPGNAPQPTEKNVSPGGGNSFSPTVKARPAPTALPGNVVTGG
ncbi:MAG TPA: hypothetical protein PKK01_04050 [Mycobacterium sp.]|nr:hypothetical protein [Mycobacterium sp.]HQE14990.1 hypothetical protein [Mycobacterium sp.]